MAASKILALLIVRSASLNISSRLELECDEGCAKLWPAELNKELRDHVCVGRGATACVFLATDNSNSRVAIKVGKDSSGKERDDRLTSWTVDCKRMQSLRMKACHAGSEMLQLHQAFLPTCTMMATRDSGAVFEAMHATGVVPIADVRKQGFSEKQRKKIFAELVASVYALHAVNLTHNDLHGHNIMLDGDHLALIDFGGLKPMEKSWKNHYKRDGSAIWRWGAKIANCPQSAQLPFYYLKPTASGGSSFLACMRTFSDEDPDFMDRLESLVNGTVKELEDHGVKALYDTDFVQNNMPTLKKYYPWEGENDCLSWSKEKWEFYEAFPGYVRCDTLPSFTHEKTVSKRGKSRTRAKKQCADPKIKTACWLRDAKKSWKCGGCEGGMVYNGYGGCLMPSHPQYKHASKYASIA